MSNISLRDPDTVSAVERGREFWRAVLLGGGSTALPGSTLGALSAPEETRADCGAAYLIA